MMVMVLGLIFSDYISLWFLLGAVLLLPIGYIAFSRIITCFFIRKAYVLLLEKLNLISLKFNSVFISKQILITNLITSVIYQLISALIFYLISVEFRLDLSYWTWCWITGLIAIASLIPLSIVGLGIREGTLIGVLTLFNAPLNTSVAISLVIYILSLQLAIIGLIFLNIKLKN